MVYFSLTPKVHSMSAQHLIVACHYILLQAVALIHFSLALQVADTLQTELTSRFLCEQNGHNPEHPCNRSGFENLINPGLNLLLILLSALTPFVNFAFVIDCEELKQRLKNFHHKERSSFPTQAQNTTVL